MKIINKEKVMQWVFLLAACTSILAVSLICFFLFTNGYTALKEIGLQDFVLGMSWRPKNEIFGIFPMIIGSIYVTAGAILFGVPLGIFTAVYLA
ncbi:MAG: phosphate ABC transporter permease subunit PstC, partial [Erysipelotrichaceae bacterium]|nr:phosphate ABC transporter permease subunit PstC [Erysipelotrichaceae bacterium]